MDAVFIAKPCFDFNSFLGITGSALGYSPAGASDASVKKLSDAERFISCLAAVRDSEALAGFQEGLLTHISYSILLAAPESAILDILSYVSGMSFIVVNTVVRGASIIILTGTIEQWKNAIADGLSCKSKVRAYYTILYRLFIQERLNVWKDYRVNTGRDKCLLLTYCGK